MSKAKEFRKSRLNSNLYKPHEVDTLLEVYLKHEVNAISDELDKKIIGCDELKDMAKEKWAFIQCKKLLNK